jgi:microcystin-dependent protein
MASILTNTGITFPDNTQQNTALPFNTIAIWSGSIASIPTGWQLCDGTNGTPDLRNKFLVGAGNSYLIGNTGGEIEVYLDSPQLPTHTHPVTAGSIGPVGNHGHPSPSTSTQGGHVHPVTAISNSGSFPHTTGAGAYQLTPSTGSGGAHAHPASTGSAGGHTHSITIASGVVGDGTGHENRPPYYALAFIMEVA